MSEQLPNILTFSRIVAIPVIVALLYVDGAAIRWIACVLFLLACATDWLDGYLARRLGVVSALGRFLDPVADKLLVVAVIVMLIADNRISGPSVLPALVILMREILISGLREFMAERRVVVAVSGLAKWKTAVQMVALALLILGQAMSLQVAGEAFLWLAAVLTVITGYDYLRAGFTTMAADARANDDG